MIGLALGAGLAAVTQASPAQALGGSLQISQSGGVTTVGITGAIITTKTGNLQNVTSPFDITFTLAGSPVADVWYDPGAPNGPEYAWGDVAVPNSGSGIYTGLAGNILSNTYIPANTAVSSLEVFNNGIIQFDLASAVNNPPSSCYTGKEYIGVTSTAQCGKYLNTMTITLSTGITGKIPSTDPVSGYPTIASLLAQFTGTYTGATGTMSSGGGEGQITFKLQQTPAPLPLLGATTAFAFSRRLRRRIARSKASTAAPR